MLTNTIVITHSCSDCNATSQAARVGMSSLTNFLCVFLYTLKVFKIFMHKYIIILIVLLYILVSIPSKLTTPKIEVLITAPLAAR